MSDSTARQSKTQTNLENHYKPVGIPALSAAALCKRMAPADKTAK
ncbi:hypothetical protein JM93_02925 [Roseibium hamelinense]|uniref:Uncharacterized protein n=1 Tax=Roseibium hamelinense TaxID=150831 RepID=A0A562SU34_9HYPH|nr:hypothetical protein [Roseibium hamelinense]TWI84593.1 hypothetical protein JM93_02925 [Roseibium hamelinense]